MYRACDISGEGHYDIVLSADGHRIALDGIRADLLHLQFHARCGTEVVHQCVLGRDIVGKQDAAVYPFAVAVVITAAGQHPAVFALIRPE